MSRRYLEYGMNGTAWARRRFRRLKAQLWALSKSKRGAGYIEYLLIVGLCALVGLVGFRTFGSALRADLGRHGGEIRGKELSVFGSAGDWSVRKGGLDPLGLFVPRSPNAPSCRAGGCGQPRKCFAAGTMVATELGDRPIEAIQVGERVWARNLETGITELEQVLKTFSRDATPVIDVELGLPESTNERESITVTPEHRFWVEGRGWVAAQFLSAAPVWSADVIFATASAPNGQTTKVYNIEVADLHNYFVGRHHALVHNDCSEEPPRLAPRDKTVLDCGDVGGYAQLGGGRRASERRKKGEKLPVVGKNRRKGGGHDFGGRLGGDMPVYTYNRDHIPSQYALKVRATTLVGELARSRLRELCPGIDSTKEDEIVARAVGQLKLDELGAAIEDVGLTVVLPTELHKNKSRTQGNKAKDTGKSDAESLAQAEADDIEAYRQFLEEFLSEDHTRSPDDKNVACAEYLLSTFDSFPRPESGESYKDFLKRRDAEYDEMLSQQIATHLEASAIDRALPSECAANH